MFNPWILLAIILAIAGAGAGGYFKGHHDAAQACTVEKAAMIHQGELERSTKAIEATQVAEKLEVKQAETRVVYKTITQTVDKIVEKPIYISTTCFDADGLRAANDALAGTIAPPAKSDQPVPAIDPLNGWPGSDSPPKVGGS